MEESAVLIVLNSTNFMNDGVMVMLYELFIIEPFDVSCKKGFSIYYLSTVNQGGPLAQGAHGGAHWAQWRAKGPNPSS